ncbi:hypothetical protein LLG95_05930 [bacterium]|nr:hypothetical protein [bacterium]
MADPLAKKHRPWRVILLSIIVGVPAVVFVFFQFVFFINGVRKDQLVPPKGLVTIQSNPATTKPTDIPKNFHEVLMAGTNKDAAALYRKWAPKLAYHDLSNPFDTRIPGRPLNPEQIAWLLANRELIDDLLRAAASAKGPIITCEEAQRLDLGSMDRGLQPIPELTLYQRFSKILAAESRRRRDAGDPKGAAETILAVQPLAISIQEPLLVNHLVAVAMQSITNQELAGWISDSIAPDIAGQLRDRLTAQKIEIAQFRRPMEVEYQTERAQVVRLLNSPFTDMVHKACEIPERDSLLTRFFMDPYQMTYHTIDLAKLKASASSELDRFDRFYGALLKEVERNEPPVNHDSSEMPFTIRFFGANFDEADVRTAVSLTSFNLNLAGLDRVAGRQPAAETDPFTKQPLKTVPVGNELCIYSLGPDRADQFGVVSYDPTNGTFSSGDIVLRVPRRE